MTIEILKLTNNHFLLFTFRFKLLLYALFTMTKVHLHTKLSMNKFCHMLRGIHRAMLPASTSE